MSLYKTTVACSEILPETKQISPIELAQVINTNAVPIILDVRTAKEYSEGHIPGAINIEYRELPSRLHGIKSSAKKQIIVYCERGFRAKIAEHTLKQAGFKKILHLQGDMSAWRSKGLEIEKD
ncbi:hypothetical protein BC008_26130 [Mastigocoleus testarum BC008]|uniref:Rhodanese domain-containing protein n=1 Tax=Mastigocoleus testarum BC008 TaxID=371196 RepID=A0A0V7ZPH2_9CYAN|nr:hypothetical protein BC008_25605 [Mastigocoleus testarum BC008]KST66671.1 hypothetical protein BC008_26130 [Mastigocoleus testarum BC008]